MACGYCQPAGATWCSYCKPSMERDFTMEQRSVLHTEFSRFILGFVLDVVMKEHVTPLREKVAALEMRVSELEADDDR